MYAHAGIWSKSAERTPGKLSALVTCYAQGNVLFDWGHLSNLNLGPLAIYRRKKKNLASSLDVHPFKYVLMILPVFVLLLICVSFSMVIFNGFPWVLQIFFFPVDFPHF